ncbi:MAG: hypothetical protein KUG78_21855 [Kangiellaceae bacterium]|nr:hypothetical protein [Kangiellaceae bacterium]
MKTGDALYADQQQRRDGWREGNAEQGYTPEEVKEFYDGIKAEILAEREAAKIQNMRTDDPNKLKLEVKLGKYLEAVISSEGIDFKGILKTGGVEVKFAKDGFGSIKQNGKSFELNELGAGGFGMDAFKVLNFKVKMTESGKLEWGVKAELINGFVKGGLSGQFNFDPVGAASRGPVGRQLRAHLPKN